ncbi:MAG: sigma factor-like helix-turn-helix DNA-binding protein, partial [Verrucomicrobiota bacterium]
AVLPEHEGGPDPSRDLASKEHFAQLDRELARLPLRLKRAFVYTVFDQLSYEEVARIEGVRVGTIKSRVHRARRRLLKGMAHEE